MTRLTTMAVALTVAATLGVARGAAAQAPQADHQHGTAAGQDSVNDHPAPDSAAGQHDHGAAAPAAGQHDMMQRHQAMMAEMHAMDAELDEKLAAMLAASGDAKVRAITEVVALMATQRGAMRDKMMQMHAEMMGGHAEPASAPGSAGVKPMSCPMCAK